MSLNLIVGRSGSGKSKLMYQNIVQDEKQGKKVLLFVPDFARIVAEEEYFKYTGNLGMINTQITTINRFCDKNVSKKELYENKDFLPEMARKFIIKKCIEDNKEEFKIFRKVKNTQGFIDKMSKLFGILDLEDINEDDICNLTQDNEFLKLKFNEIYTMYKKVKEETEERFITSHEMLDFFISNVLNKKIKSIKDNTKVYFDGFNNFNKKELEFIKAILQMGQEVTVLIDLDIEKIDRTDIFEISYDTYKKLNKISKDVGCKVYETILNNDNKKCTMLSELQNKIFTLAEKKSLIKDETVCVKLLKNTCDEILYIAQDIQKRIREENKRYSDFKIYYNNEELYNLTISKIFDEYGIPVYINGSETVKSNTIVVYLLNLLKQVKNGFNGVSLENILQLLKTGLTNIQENNINMFENYVNEFGIKLYSFKEKFERNNNGKDSSSIVYDLEQINLIRKYIYESVMHIKNAVNNIADTKEFSRIIFEFLQEQGVIQKYSEQIQTIREYSVDECNRKKQVVQYLYEIMDNISLAFENLSFEEYVALFEYGIDNIEVSSIPPFIDQVEVCNIDSTRSLSRKNVYIIGAFENGLPILSNDEGLFTDRELAKLQEYGIELAKTSENRNNMALFNVYKAVNSCMEKLIITIPSAKVTGENLRLSPLIWRIKDILDIEVKSDFEDEIKELYNIGDIFKNFINKIQNIENISEQQFNDIYSDYLILINNDRYKEILDYNRKKEYLSKETTSYLYNKDILSSVSRLERFNMCPLNYFANYVLKLKEKKEYKLSNLDMGSIMHKVIENFSKYLIANSLGFEDIFDDEKHINETKKEISKSIDEIFDTMYIKYNSSAKYVYYKKKLNTGIFNIIKSISQSFRQSEFRPLGFEIEFDQGKLFAPIEIELDNGTKMYLRGKIDRVDVAKIKDTVYLRVVDYKSSNKDLKLSDVKEGVSLQLMTYMSALIENKDKINKKENVLPAALSYFTLNTNILSLSGEMTEDQITEQLINAIKMKGIYLSDVEILNKLDNKFTEPKNSYIDITQRRLNNSEKALSESKFLEECNSIKNTLKKIGNELVSGSVSVGKKEKNCEYCNYSNFCRKKIMN